MFIASLVTVEVWIEKGHELLKVVRIEAHHSEGGRKVPIVFCKTLRKLTPMKFFFWILIRLMEYRLWCMPVVAFERATFVPTFGVTS